MGLFTYAKSFSRAMTRSQIPRINHQFSFAKFTPTSTILPSAFLIKSPGFQTLIASLGNSEGLISEDDEESSTLHNSKDRRIK